MGLADGMTVADIAKKHGVDVSVIKAQIKQGAKVEKEHTDDSKEAVRIAMDHLVEDRKYYSKLSTLGL